MFAAVKNNNSMDFQLQILHIQNLNFLMEMYGKRQRAGLFAGREGASFVGGTGRQSRTGVILSTGRDGIVQRGGVWWRDGTVNDNG